MRAGYLAATGIAAEIYTSRASAGAHAIAGPLHSYCNRLYL
jgi:hypothetical protein